MRSRALIAEVVAGFTNGLQGLSWHTFTVHWHRRRAPTPQGAVAGAGGGGGGGGWQVRFEIEILVEFTVEPEGEDPDDSEGIPEHENWHHAIWQATAGAWNKKQEWREIPAKDFKDEKKKAGEDFKQKGDSASKEFDNDTNHVGGPKDNANEYARRGGA